MNTAYCFSLDGALTCQELLPLIASSVGLEDEINLLTQAAVQGLLPFDKVFKLRLSLLRDARQDIVHTILGGVKINSSIIEFIRRNPDRSFILTGNPDVWVSPMLTRLGVNYFASKARVDKSGRIEGIDFILHKGDMVNELRRRFDRIVAVGEGINDISMFESADWRIAYGGVHVPNKDLLKVSDFVIYDGKALCRLLNML